MERLYNISKSNLKFTNRKVLNFFEFLSLNDNEKKSTRK